MGNILSHASSPSSTLATDERWLKMTASELFEIENLTKEYSKLPVFKHTEAPAFPPNSSSSPLSSDTDASLSDLADVFTMNELLSLSDEEANPFGSFSGIDEMVKYFISQNRSPEGISGKVKGGFDSGFTQTLLRNNRSGDPLHLAAELHKRVRARALLRLHLAVTRHNDIKSSSLTAPAPVAAGASTASANNPPSNPLASTSPTAGQSEADAPAPVVALFSELKAALPSVPSQDSFASELFFSTGITVAVATAEGLCNSPYYDHVSRHLMLSVIDILAPFVSQLMPLPREVVSPMKVTSLAATVTASKPQHTHPFAGCQVFTAWDRSISNSSLAFSEQDTIAGRPGSVSSYPAAFCKPDSDKCSLSVMLVDGKSSNNWLTIGICSKAFPNASSDGFGRQADSWGIQDDRSSSNEINIISNGTKIGTFRKLVVGDIISVVVDFSERWCDVLVNFDLVKRFVLSETQTLIPDQYYVGATFANDHKLQVLPFPFFELMALHEDPKHGCLPSKKRRVLCSGNHDMARFVNEPPPAYVERHRTTSVTVNCDKCARKAIQSDLLCFYHCSVCSYDLCFLCSLPASSTGLAVLENSTSSKTSARASSSSECTLRSPLAVLRPDSPSLLAIEKLLAIARNRIQMVARQESTVSSSTYSIGALTASVQDLIVEDSFSSRIAAKKSRKLPASASPEKATTSPMSLSRPQDDAISLLFSVAVLKESLHNILEVVFTLSSDEALSTGAPVIAPWASRFVERLIGKSSSTEGQAADSSQADASLDLFFSCERDGAGASVGNKTLFDSLDWKEDRLLCLSDRQAVAILNAIGDVSAGTDAASYFPVVDDSYFDLLLETAEKGAKVLQQLAELQSAGQTEAVQEMSQQRICRRDVYLGSAALKVIFFNLKRLFTSVSGPEKIATLLDVSCGEEGLFLSASAPPTYRARVRALTDAIVANPFISPDTNEFGACAILFTALRDALIPKASEQFSLICSLLEKSDGGLDTPCERALVMKLMEGMEGPKLLELVTPKKGDTAGESDNIERFVKSILLLADRSLVGKIERRVSGVDSEGSGEGQSLSEGMLRVLEPITVQTFSTLANTLLTAKDAHVRNRSMASLVDMISQLIHSSQIVLDSLNSSFRHLEKLSGQELVNVGRIFLSLSQELSRSHLASLVPLSLFATSVLWTDLSLPGDRHKALPLVGLFDQLTALMESINSTERLLRSVNRQGIAISDSSVVLEAGASSLGLPSLEATLKSLTPTVSTWDLALSNNSLVFSDQNRACIRPGSASCYPAAFSTLNTDCATFSVTLTEAGSTTNWLSLGLVKKGFATQSSDGVGRTANSWGIADDRSKSSENAFFCCNGNRLSSAPRKLKVGDTIVMTVDIKVGKLGIAVNEGEFRFEFAAGAELQGVPSDFWFAATFANDHKLTINTVTPEVSLKSTPTAADSWLKRLSDEVRTLQLHSMTQLLEYPVHPKQAVAAAAGLVGPGKSEISSTPTVVEARDRLSIVSDSTRDSISSDSTDSSPMLRGEGVFDLHGDSDEDEEEEEEEDEDEEEEEGEEVEEENGVTCVDAAAPGAVESNLDISSIEEDTDDVISDPLKLAEISNWLDSPLLINGVFDASKSEQSSDTDFLQAIASLSPLSSQTASSFLQSSPSGGPQSLNAFSLAQWALLRQLTDAPNGLGESQRLVSVMKRFVREDQGTEAGPNHAVHATCAALIWHEGLGAEAIEIVTAALQGKEKEIRPSAAFQNIWKLSQSMRKIFPENCIDESPVVAKSPGAAAESATGAGALGNSTVDEENDSDIDLASPPIKLQKQYSLPIPDHGQGPLSPLTLAAVRRARLLLGYYPATFSQSARPSSKLSSSFRPRSGSEMTRSFYERLKSEFCVDFETNGRHNVNPKAKLANLSMATCVLNFIEFGPDPDAIRKVAEDRRKLSQMRVNGYVTAKALLQSTSGVRNTGEVLCQLSQSIASLNSGVSAVAASPIEAAAADVAQLTSSVGTSDSTSSVVDSTGARKTFKKIDTAIFSSSGLHFAKSLNGTGREVKLRVYNEWAQLVSIVCKVVTPWLHEIDSIIDKSVNHPQHLSSESLISLEFAVLSALAVVGQDFIEDDIKYIVPSGIFGFLDHASLSQSTPIRKAALSLIEQLLHLCCSTLQSSIRITVEAPAVLPSPESTTASSNLLSLLLQFMSHRVASASISSCLHKSSSSLLNCVSLGTELTEASCQDAQLTVSEVAPIFKGTYFCDPTEEGCSLHLRSLFAISDVSPLHFADHSLSMWLWVPEVNATGTILTRLMGVVAPWSFLSMQLIEGKLVMFVGNKLTIGNVSDFTSTSTLGSDSYCNVNLKTFEGVHMTSEATLTCRQWLHVGCTLDARAGLAYLYVNGDIVAHTVLPPSMSTSAFPYPEVFDFDRTLLPDLGLSSQPFILGQAPSTFATIGKSSNAAVANVCLATRPLSLRDYAKLGVETAPRDAPALPFTYRVSAKQMQYPDSLSAVTSATSDDDQLSGTEAQSGRLTFVDYSGGEEVCGIMCSNPADALQVQTAYSQMPKGVDETTFRGRIMSDATGVGANLAFGIIVQLKPVASSTTVPPELPDVHDINLFDGKYHSFGVRNKYEDGLWSSAIMTHVDPSGAIYSQSSEMPPMRVGDEITMTVNLTDETLKISVSNEITSFSYSTKISKAFESSSVEGKATSAPEVAVFFGATLSPGQQILLVHPKKPEIQAMEESIPASPALEAPASPSLPAADTSTAPALLVESAIEAPQVVPEETPADLCQTVSTWDPTLSDRQRLELTSFDTTIYFPGHATNTPSSSSVPLVATRLTHPRATFTVMISRNVMLDGILSIGVARAFPDLLPMASGASPLAEASMKRLPKLASSFFSPKSGFGIENGSWGIYDERKEDSTAAAMVNAGGSEEPPIAFRKLFEGDLVTWTVDFLCEDPWAQLTVNGEEFSMKFKGLRGHYQQYIFGMVLAMEHEVILIADSSSVDCLPAPVFPSVSASSEEMCCPEAEVLSINYETPYHTADDISIAKKYVVTWDSVQMSHWTNRRVFNRSSISRGDAMRLIAASARICRSLLSLTIIQNVSADLEGVDNPPIQSPFAGSLSKWVVDSKVLHAMISFAFGSTSSLLRLAGNKLLTRVVPLLAPESLDQALLDLQLVRSRLPLQVGYFNFHTAALVQLGQLLNPYCNGTLRYAEHDSIPYSLDFSPLSVTAGIRQLYDLLMALGRSPLRAWWDYINASLVSTLPSSIDALGELRVALNAAYAVLNRSGTEEVGLPDTLQSTLPPSDTLIGALLGLLATLGGMSSGFALVPGTKVVHRGIGGSLAEPHAIIAFGKLGIFGESVYAVPLTADESVSTISSQQEQVLTFSLQAEQGRASVSPAVLHSIRSSSLISAFLHLSLKALAIDTPDLRPKMAKEAEVDDKPAQSQSRCIYMESPHPYLNNTNDKFDIAIPGATELTITFDPQTKTEANYDYLRFYKDASHTAYWGAEKYSGTVWPGVNGQEPLKIGAGSCVLSFHTDGSNTDWGYKFKVEAVIKVESVRSARPPFAELSLLRYVKLMSADAASKVLVKPNSLRVRSEGACYSPSRYSPAAIVAPDSNIVALNSCRDSFARESLPYLLQTIVTHTIMSKVFDSKSPDPRKDVDLSYVPKASSTYLSRIVQTLTGCNIFYRADSQSSVSLQDINSTTSDSYLNDFGSGSVLVQEIVASLDTNAVNHALNEMVFNQSQATGMQLSPVMASALSANGSSSTVTFPDQANISHLMSSSGTQVSRVGDSETSGPSANSPNSDEDTGFVKFRLNCSHGTTHCRVRAKPSLESAEVGDIANATIVDISGQVGDFYRLADNRGFVKVYVPDAVVWERQDPYKGGANKNVDFLERLLLNESGSLTAWNCYCLLCDLLSNWPADCSITDHLSSGLLHLLLKVAGLGKMVPAKALPGKMSTELVAKNTPLLNAFKRLLINAAQSGVSSPARTPLLASIPTPHHPSILALTLINIATNLFKQVKAISIEEKGKQQEVQFVPPIPPVTLESAHEYENNTDFTTRIHLPGAVGIEITFVEETSTERNYDYVSFYAEQEKRTLLAGKFSGRRASGEKNWPGVGGRPSLIIEGRDDCWLSFVTDGSNTDWGWKLTATAITAVTVNEKVQSDLSVQFSSAASTEWQVCGPNVITSGIAMVNLEGGLKRPSLGIALALFETLTESVLSSELLFTTPYCIELLEAMSLCADIVGDAHPLLAKSFIDAVSRITLLFNGEIQSLATVINSAELPIDHQEGLSPLQAQSKRILLMMSTLSKHVLSLAESAIDARKAAASRSSSSSTSSSVLLQSIAQAAISSANCVEAQASITEMNTLSIEPVVVDDQLDIPANPELGLGANVIATLGGRGVRRISNKSSTTDKAVDNTSETTWGPVFPLVTFPLLAESVSTEASESSPAEAEAKEGEEPAIPEANPLLGYSHTHYVKVLSLGSAAADSSLMSVGVSILPAACITSTVETRPQRLAIEWRADGVALLSGSNRDDTGASFAVDDILGFTLELHTISTFSVSLSRNGVNMGQYHGSFDDSNGEITFSNVVQSEVVCCTAGVSASSARFALAVALKLAPGSEVVFLCPNELPAGIRKSSSVDFGKIAPNAAPKKLATILGSKDAFVGGIIKRWDRSISDTELQFSDEDTTAQRPGSVSCYPASLVNLSTLPSDISNELGSYSITVMLTKAPRGPNSMSFGIAKLGFKKSGSDGFGSSSNSWGLLESRSSGDGKVYANREQLSTFRKMQEGDIFALRYERRLGKAWLMIGTNFEFCYEFTIHNPEENVDLVVGATFCNDHVLKIMDVPPPPIPEKYISSFDALPAPVLSVPSNAAPTEAPKAPKVVTVASAAAAPLVELLAWDRTISQSNLEYSNNDRTAKRPGSVSCYPAALIPVPPNTRCSLTAVLEEAPVNNNTMSFGIAVTGFSNSGTQAFGERPKSWGVFNNRSDTASNTATLVYADGTVLTTTFRKLQAGDVFQIIVDVAAGSATLTINKTEFSQTFSIPADKQFVVGATFCNDHKLTIPLPSAPAPIDSGLVAASGSASGSCTAVVDNASNDLKFLDVMRFNAAYIGVSASPDLGALSYMSKRSQVAGVSASESISDLFSNSFSEVLDDLAILQMSPAEQIKKVNFEPISSRLPGSLKSLANVGTALTMLLSDDSKLVSGSILCSFLPGYSKLKTVLVLPQLSTTQSSFYREVRIPGACSYVVKLPTRFQLPSGFKLRVSAFICSPVKASSEPLACEVLCEEFGHDGSIWVTGDNGTSLMQSCSTWLSAATAEAVSSSRLTWTAAADLEVGEVASPTPATEGEQAVSGSSIRRIEIGDVVIRGSAWSHGREDGGAGEVGDVVEVQSNSSASESQLPTYTVLVKWRCNQVEGAYLMPSDAAAPAPLKLYRRSLFRRLSTSEVQSDGSVKVQEAAQKTSLSGDGGSLFTPLMTSHVLIELLPLAIGSSSAAAASAVDTSFLDQLSILVTPLFTPKAVLKSPDFVQFKAEINRLSNFVFRGDHVDFSLKDRVDSAVVTIVEKTIKAKSITGDRAMPAHWNEQPLSPEDILHFPVLTTVVSSRVSHPSEELAAVVNEVIAYEQTNKKATEVASNVLLGARYTLIKLLNAELVVGQELIDLQRMAVTPTIGRSKHSSDSVAVRSRPVARLLSAGRKYLLSWLKSAIVQRCMATAAGDSSKFELVISRSRSVKFSSIGEVDTDGRWSVFGQVFRRIHGMPSSVLRRSGQLWDTVFAGERAQDAGGPYREVWSAICQDLMSPHVPLLKPCPNRILQSGVNADTFVLNPDCAQNPTQMEMLVFLGKLMGSAARNKNYLDLYISPIIWKAIVRQELTLEDVRDIDTNGVNQVQRLRQRKIVVNDIKQELTEEYFTHGYTDLYFSIISKGGTVIELHPGGASELVSWGSDIDRYCDEVEHYWLNVEYAAVAEAVRAGIETQLSAEVLNLVRWDEFEEMVCGSPKIDVALLQAATEYERGCSNTEPHILWFWELLQQDFSEVDRRAFVRFVWGRTRLPLTRAAFTQPFKIQGFTVRGSGNADNYLPVSHTCFFSVELPRYSSKQVMLNKLLYAIHNCTAIDGDDTGAGMRAAALGMET